MKLLVTFIIFILPLHAMEGVNRTSLKQFCNELPGLEGQAFIDKVNEFQEKEPLLFKTFMSMKVSEVATKRVAANYGLQYIQNGLQYIQNVISGSNFIEASAANRENEITLENFNKEVETTGAVIITPFIDPQLKDVNYGKMFAKLNEDEPFTNESCQDLFEKANEKVAELQDAFDMATPDIGYDNFSYLNSDERSCDNFKVDGVGSCTTNMSHSYPSSTSIQDEGFSDLANFILNAELSNFTSRDGMFARDSFCRCNKERIEQNQDPVKTEQFAKDLGQKFKQESIKTSVLKMVKVYEDEVARYNVKGFLDASAYGPRVARVSCFSGNIVEEIKKKKNCGANFDEASLEAALDGITGDASVGGTIDEKLKFINDSSQTFADSCGKAKMSSFNLLKAQMFTDKDVKARVDVVDNIFEDILANPTSKAALREYGTLQNRNKNPGYNFTYRLLKEGGEENCKTLQKVVGHVLTYFVGADEEGKPNQLTEFDVYDDKVIRDIKRFHQGYQNTSLTNLSADYHNGICNDLKDPITDEVIRDKRHRALIFGPMIDKFLQYAVNTNENYANLYSDIGKIPERLNEAGVSTISDFITKNEFDSNQQVKLAQNRCDTVLSELAEKICADPSEFMVSDDIVVKQFDGQNKAGFEDYICNQHKPNTESRKTFTDVNLAEQRDMPNLVLKLVKDPYERNRLYKRNNGLIAIKNFSGKVCKDDASEMLTKTMAEFGMLERASIAAIRSGIKNGTINGKDAVDIANNMGIGGSFANSIANGGGSFDDYSHGNLPSYGSKIIENSVTSESGYAGYQSDMAADYRFIQNQGKDKESGVFNSKPSNSGFIETFNEEDYRASTEVAVDASTRTIASVTDEENSNNSGAKTSRRKTRSEEVVEEYLDEDVSITKNDPDQSGFSSSQYEFFKKLYDKETDNGNLAQENKKLKSQLEYLNRIKDLEKQLEDKKAQFNKINSESSLPANGNPFYTSNSNLGVTSSSRGEGQTTGDGSGSSRNSQGASFGGTGSNNQSAISGNSPSGTTNRSVSGTKGASGSHNLYLKGVNSSTINLEDEAVVNEIKDVVKNMYDNDIYALLENYHDGKIKIVLDDGKTVDIEASKILSLDEIKSLDEKKLELVKLQESQKSIRQTESELYKELVGLSNLLARNGNIK